MFKLSDPRRLLVLLIVLLLGLVSNYYYQPLFSPLFNSDHAIWVLMTREFHWPDSIYFWGQNRLGSLIPLAAHLIYLAGVKAMAALSLTQLLVQFFSVLLVLRLQRDPWSAVFFAVALLLPAWPYINITFPGHPYLSQVFLFLGFLWFLDRIRQKPAAVFSALFIGILLLWVSEISIIFILISILFYRDALIGLPRRTLIWAMIILPLEILLVLIVRNQFPKSTGYDQFFATGTEMQTNISGFLNSSYGYFSTESTYVVAAIALIMAFSAWLLVKNFNRKTGILLLSSVTSLAITIMSHWVFLNNSGSRYFVLPVYLFLLSVCFALPKDRSWIKLILVASVLAIGWKGLGYIKPGMSIAAGRPNRVEMERLAREVNQAYNVTGDYWSVYLYAVFRPDVKVNPVTRFNARNRWDREEVFNSDTLLVINWRNPDTLELDNGVNFVPEGTLLQVGQSQAAVYTRVKE